MAKEADDMGFGDVEVIEQHKDLLRSGESLYTRRPVVPYVEERDLSYFSFMSQNESRKSIVGVFGSGGAGKSSFVRLLGSRSFVRGTRDVSPTETDYERKRDTTIHIHPCVIPLSRSNGSSGIFTLLDTSGHMDFASEAVGVVNKIDVAVMVIDVQNALCLHSELMLETIKLAGKPLIVVFNKVDVSSSGGLKHKLYERIRYLRDLISRTLSADGFFAMTTRHSRIIKMNSEVALESLDVVVDCPDALDELVDLFLDQRIFRYRRVAETVSYNPRVFSCNASDDVVSFLAVGDLILCSLISNGTVSSGSLVNIGGIDVCVERIYIPFFGCLVESDAVSSKIGVLVRIREGTLPPTSPHNGRVHLSSLVNATGQRYARTQDGDPDIILSMQDSYGSDPPIKVGLRPETREEFDSNVHRLMLVYQDLRVDGCVVSGNGELFMDAVLHDLRTILKTRFEVVSVFSDLKETVQDDATLMEPVYLVEIHHKADAEELVDGLVCSSRGHIIHENSVPLYELRRLLVYIPVVECFGFETDLRVYSCLLADCSKVFSHWAPIENRDRATELVDFVRKIKR